MEKLILSDVDEVLLHWKKDFDTFIQSKGIVPSKPWTSHELHEWLEIHPDEAQALVGEFNGSKHLAALEPYKYSVECVTKLHKEGWRFVAVTACGDTDFISETRRKNLQHHFGSIFQEIHCVSYQQGKIDILKSYPNTWWIEDNFTWAQAGADLGHKTLLVDQPHNQHHYDDRIRRVQDWREIYEIISAEN